MERDGANHGQHSPATMRRGLSGPALQYAASLHCLVEEWQVCGELRPKHKEKRHFLDRKLEAKRHRTEWCAAASKYRCMSCGGSSKKDEDDREV